MGISLENAQKWLGNIRTGGVLPQIDVALLNASIANAGNVTKGIDLDTQTPEQLEALAMKSVETAPFADKAQSKEILQAYIKSDLIPSSYKIDEEKGLEKGASLRKFLGDTKNATRGVDFDAFKKDPMGFMMKQDKKEVERITTEIRGSAHENIKHDILSKDGKEGSRTIEQDFVHSVKTKTDEHGESIYKDVKADDPKPLGGGMLEIIMAFIGMLLGVDLAGMFGGKSPSNASYDERAQDNSQATPQQQETTSKIEKSVKFAEILKDNAISQNEFGDVLKLGGNQQTREQVMVMAASDHVTLVPNAQGDNPGDTVIFAKRDEGGKLSEIQVTTKAADGTATTKSVEGDFILTDGNKKEVGSAIVAEAEKNGKAVDGASPNVLADDIASGLSAAVNKLREQGANR